MELNIEHASDQHTVLLHTHVQDIEYIFFLMVLIFVMAETYKVAHEKPARRLVDQRGRRSRTLYRKIKKCKCKVLTG
jgi:hypothetical protein